MEENVKTKPNTAAGRHHFLRPGFQRLDLRGIRHNLPAADDRGGGRLEGEGGGGGGRGGWVAVST